MSRVMSEKMKGRGRVRRWVRGERTQFPVGVKGESRVTIPLRLPVQPPTCPPVLRQVSWKREVSELKMACGDGTGGSEGLPPPSSGPKILPGGCELPPPLSSSHALLGSSSAAPEAICNCLLYLFLTFSKSVLFSHGCCVK